LFIGRQDEEGLWFIAATFLLGTLPCPPSQGLLAEINLKTFIKREGEPIEKGHFVKIAGALDPEWADFDK